MCNKIVNRQNAHRVRVLLPSIPDSELTDLQLEELLRSLSRLEEQSVVVVAETMAELRGRGEGWAVLGWWDRRRRTKWMWTGLP